MSKRTVRSIVVLILFIAIVLFTAKYHLNEPIITNFEYAEQVDQIVQLMIVDSEKAEAIYKELINARENTLQQKPVESRYFIEPKEAIAFVRYRYEKDGTLKDLETHKKQIESELNQLKEPPPEYQKLYSIAAEMYSSYSKIIELSISPPTSIVEQQLPIDQLIDNIKKSKYEFDKAL